MKVLDLFSGTQSIAKAFREKGHQTYTIELDKRHEGIDWYEDIMKINAEDIVKRFGYPDIIWASPPCEKFSVASIGKHWIKGTNNPKDEETKQALKLLEHTIELIKELKPKFYYPISCITVNFIENVDTKQHNKISFLFIHSLYHYHNANINYSTN